MGNEKSGNEVGEQQTFWRVNSFGAIREVTAESRKAEESNRLWYHTHSTYFTSKTNAVEFLLCKYHDDIKKVEETFKCEHRLAKQRLERFKKK